MAEPMTITERRLNRLEDAVETMAAWLVQAQTGFGQKDYEGIKAILEGTYKEEHKPDTGSKARSQ
ncbi:MAG: hypothetical protein ABWY25_07685 [Paenisporosarcina sp.]